MGKTNREWHATHHMPTKAGLDERVAWHLAHAQNCDCRPMPASIVAALNARGISAAAPRKPVSGKH